MEAVCMLGLLDREDAGSLMWDAGHAEDVSESSGLHAMAPKLCVSLPAQDTMPSCSQQGIACFASELEQDIAALEAEAKRHDQADWDVCCADDTLGSCETGLNKAASDDLESFDRDQASDSDSDEESEQPEDAAAARIQANARMVQHCGRPMQTGAWKGCCKSAWCDREDRHRGLCNHRATIPGPAACPAQSDACSSESHDDAFCEGANTSCTHHQQLQQQQAEEVSSGGHSHNCTTREAGEGDEREVASALKTGIHHQDSMEEASMPFSLPQLQHEHLTCAASHHQQQQQQAQQVVPGLFWASSSSGGQLASDEQLFAMPAVYQPRVKDLEAPDISSMLSDEGLCNIEVPLDVAVHSVPVPLEDLDSITMDTSSQTFVKPGFSAPSSPSCASAAAMVDATPFAMAVPAAAAVLPLPLAVTVTPAATLAVVSVVSVGSMCIAGLLRLEEVHPPASTGSSTAPATSPVPAPAAAAVAATSLPEAAAAAASLVPDAADTAEPEPMLVDSSVSEEAAPTSATADATADATAATALAFPAPAVAAALAPAAAAAEAPAADTAEAPADAPTEAPTAAAVADTAAPAAPAKAGKGSAAASKQQPSVPLMTRAPRIKHKPRRADDPPRPLLEQQPTSPKSKKRPAGRMAPSPSNGHCCTQCGAVSTPVWRAGPAGPKTLCNACGVRYMKTARRK